MPRKARLDAPGTLHHVIIRGIERRPTLTNADTLTGAWRKAQGIGRKGRSGEVGNRGQILNSELEEKNAESGTPYK